MKQNKCKNKYLIDFDVIYNKFYNKYSYLYTCKSSDFRVLDTIILTPYKIYMYSIFMLNYS